jgi:uncharacterized protein YbjQ (UPF0145 family)
LIWYFHDEHFICIIVCDSGKRTGVLLTAQAYTVVQPKEDVRMAYEGSRTGRPFTSDLSGQEFWLLRDQGYIPVGFVLGNSVYSMGVTGGIKSWARGLIKGEIKELTQLMYDARSLALRRMEEEAARLGADGVVGVDIVVNHHGDLMEVTATGTAIKRDPNWTPQPSRLQVVMDAASETSGKTQLDV